MTAQVNEQLVDIAFEAASRAVPASVEIGRGELSTIVRAALNAALPDGYRLLPRKPTGTMLEVMAFNLSDEFGSEFVAEAKDFALAVYDEAWALGINLSAPHHSVQASQQ